MPRHFTRRAGRLALRTTTTSNMLEIVLSTLLAVASGLGVFFWRKSTMASEEARRDVEALRVKAREDNELREKTIQANLDHIDEKLDKVADDRAALASLLNRRD